MHLKADNCMPRLQSTQGSCNPLINYTNMNQTCITCHQRHCTPAQMPSPGDAMHPCAALNLPKAPKHACAEAFLLQTSQTTHARAETPHACADAFTWRRHAPVCCPQLAKRRQSMSVQRPSLADITNHTCPCRDTTRLRRCLHLETPCTRVLPSTCQRHQSMPVQRPSLADITNHTCPCRDTTRLRRCLHLETLRARALALNWPKGTVQAPHFT